MQHLPEPARHPRVVRAAVSPSAIAVTAAGVGIGIGAAHSVVLAVVLGAGAWAGRMVLAAVRQARRAKAARPHPARVDPWSVPEPWRQLLRQAVDAQTRFDEAIKEWPAGPIRDRLVGIQPRLYSDVEQIGLVAHRGASLSGWTPGGTAVTGRPTGQDLSDQLRRIEADRRAIGPSAPAREAALARTEEALAAQLRAIRGAEDAAAQVHDRLRVLVARLDEAVTALLVLGVDSTGPGGAEALAASVDSIVEEINALHLGLADANASATPSLPSTPASTALPPSPSHQPPPPAPTP